MKWSKKDEFVLGICFVQKISQGIYIIENRFNNNSKMLKTKVIIFKIFHNFPDNVRLILLSIIDNMQKAILNIVVSHLPFKKSGKYLSNIATRSAWIFPKLKACIHSPRIERGIDKIKNPASVKIFKRCGVKAFMYFLLMTFC